MRHPLGLIMFGILFGLMVVKQYLRFGFDHAPYLALGATLCVIAIAGGIYVWRRWFGGSFRLIAATTILFLTTVIGSQLADGGFGPTERDRRNDAYYAAEMRLLQDYLRQPISNNAQVSAFYARSADLKLRLLGDREWAKDALQKAVAEAKEHQVAGYGLMGTRIDPELAALLPDVHFVQTRASTLVRYD